MPLTRFAWPRLPAMGAVVLLHVACYWAVTRFNAGRDPAAFVQLTTPLDTLIPHLPWTWPFYWLTYPFVVVGSAAALLRVSPATFQRGLVAMIGVTLIGAATQVLLPAEAPWPPEPAPIQQRYHDSFLVLPYANLPSMHVTYVVMAAGFLVTVFRHSGVRIVASIVTAGVVLSTVTLKEHFVLDAVTGLLLSAAAISWWRRGIPVEERAG